ncbi:MAG: DNA-directed RNA polymerase subunit delta [Sulfobacillus benefaciens]|uniref:RNAP delta factor n=1 Tax=Sulfobacillus benefaciens TaxID=453960 RepID=A0A2T2WWP0_9FIRM|nr:MAG: DNA-directed RNA polymerase subunit delta [Sulfobacillus benefaciens]HBQ93812.1 DNA-directed RNA polymerase subunit delta [Sulfobacillus sp.]
MQVTDAAYEVLKEHGQPMEVQDLLDETLRKLGVDREPKQAAKIYTDINLDVRFQYRGNAMWGLKEWLPKTVAKGSTPRSSELAMDDDNGDTEEDEG